MKPEFPLNYYWKEYSNGECPLCKIKKLVKKTRIIFHSDYNLDGNIISKKHCCRYCNNNAHGEKEFKKDTKFFTQIAITIMS